MQGNSAAAVGQYAEIAEYQIAELSFVLISEFCNQKLCVE
jgi:hypothetical protein